MKKLQVPLFRSYLFVKILPNERYKVLNHNGVVNFINYNGKPAIVREEEIEAINKFISNDVDICNEECIPLGIGERVKVTTGPLNGIEGTIHQKKGSKRLYLELTTIHQTLSVDVPLDCLQRI